MKVSTYSTAVRLLKEKPGVLFGYVSLFCLLAMYSISLRSYESSSRLLDLIRTTDSRNEVVVVGIDDASLQEIGAWPWDRNIFAQLTKTLDDAGARVVAYDVLFFEPRTGDEALKQVLDNAEHTVLLASRVDSGEYLSSYLLSGSRAESALANVHPDRDGKVRSYPRGFLSSDTCTLSLSQMAFAVYTKKELPCDPEATFRYPKTITEYSLVDVLRGSVTPESFKDKVVFIGSTSLGLEDHFIGMQGSKSPGVYVHASAFTSYLNAVHDVRLPRAAEGFLILIVGLITTGLLFFFKRALTQLGAVIGLELGVVLISVAAFSAGYTIPVTALLGTVLIVAGYTALIRFLEERKQNVFIEQIFSKYVHKDVLQELLHSGKEIALGGERKTLTVLFSDIRGFTTLSESLSPEELTSILNAYLSDMTPHILEEKGTIDKFIGDAIMAFWNAPLPVAHHERHAVKAALKMHDALEMFNTHHTTHLAAGIGIHTGSVVVGNVGGKDRVNYTILGDTVNLTSRLEGLTKKYGVATIVTMAVKDAITDEKIAFRCLDVITVAGKSTPTTLYEARYAHDFSEGLIEEYEKALTYYYQGQWNSAERIFKKLAKGGDKPSEKMLERIPELRKKEKWDGIWRFDEK